MAEKVKSKREARKTTRVSRKHQVTIPAVAFRMAGLEPGDTLQAEALGAGQVVLTRVDELVNRYSGALDTGGKLHDRVEGLADEWR